MKWIKINHKKIIPNMTLWAPDRDILKSSGKDERHFTNIKEVCSFYGWNYNTIKCKKIPFEFKGITIIKIKLSEL
jgi:hypothetical protein